ncbi:MAG TPA: protein kinase, partial [Kofleriaceae bacterium]|nr:protein kinase [Kofleriaceae bacterium]
MSGAIAAALDELAVRSPEEWPALLRARFPGDPGLTRQLLLWLHASRDPAGPGEPGKAGGHADPGELAGVDDRTGAGPLGASTRYELGVRLDDGATASVWRAYDRKLRRNVAIKVFRAGSSLATGEILAEARAAAEVISEHVVRVIDVHDAEPPYIVMELVGEHEPRTGALQPGASAATCRPRDLWEAVRWVHDVARGVHDAHLRNVFHRDLKPHNVLITPISRRARIADFGLAVTAQTDPAETAGTPLIRTGPSGAVSVQGTPE